MKIIRFWIVVLIILTLLSITLSVYSIIIETEQQKNPPKKEQIREGFDGPGSVNKNY